MNNLSRLHSIKEIEALQSRPSVLSRINGFEQLPAIAARLPLVDITESEDELLIEAEFPGVTREGLKVVITSSTLTITGEQGDATRVTMNHDIVAWAFPLPDDFDFGPVSAGFRNGKVHVRLPMKDMSSASESETAPCLELQPE